MSASLSQPEYLHVLLNPLLTHALPLAALGLLVALICRSRAAVRLALVLVALGGAAVWPVVHYGEDGFDRVQAMADSTGSDWLAVHRHRAEDAEWLFYVTAALALVALVAPRKWPASATPLALAALLAALAASTVAAWVAYPAGRVRHREFRHGPPPAAEVQAAAKEADGS
jgi:hypothetical protein